MLPDAGDIVWAELDPLLGSEQAGRWPVLVISPRSLHEVSRRTHLSHHVATLRLDHDGSASRGLRVTGSVLTDQLRSVDRAARMHDFIEQAPVEVLAEVRARHGSILGIL
jgi:mRNA interferase MazF